ncbi:hypothetical protein [Desulfoluna sp.]|uniref:hypothetical protein n=1 Tax=Desulfoluna sp. TaxID=2045199 RepID=UPI002617548A|nr:hypothetical protein [Desulfoluna sp.]
MKKSHLLFLTAALTAVLMLSGCASFMGMFSKEGRAMNAANSARKQGNYPLAIQKSVEATKLNPEYEKAYTFIREAYPQGISLYTSRIEQNKHSSVKFAWDSVYHDYDALVKMTDNIKAATLPLVHPVEGWKFSPEIKDYTAQRKTAKAKAIEGHYTEGVRLSKLSDWNAKKGCWAQFQKASEMAGKAYKDGKKIAAASYYKEGMKRCKAPTWDKRETAIPVFTTLTTIWGKEYNKHFTSAADLYYKHGKALEAKNTRPGYREAVESYEQSLKWVPNYKDTDVLIAAAKMKAYVCYYVLETSSKDESRLAKSIASEIKSKLKSPDGFKNFNDSSARKNFSSETFSAYPSVLVALEENGYRKNTISSVAAGARKVGSGTVITVSLSEGTYRNPRATAVNKVRDSFAEYLTDSHGRLILDEYRKTPIIAGTWNNSNLKDGGPTKRGFVEGVGVGEHRLGAFKKFHMSYRQHTLRASLSTTITVNIFDVSRGKVLDTYKKSYTADDKKSWEDNKSGNATIFSSQMTDEYPKRLLSKEDLRRECIRQLEKKSATWAAKKLTRYYP